MPTTVAAAIAANAASAAVGGGLLGAVLGGVASFAVTAALSGESDAGAPPETSQPAGQLDQEARSRTLTVRQAVAPWQWIYGQVRVGGIVTFMEEDADGALHLVVTLAGHACEELGTVWFDGDELTLDGSGNVTAPSRYVGKAVIEKSLGTEAAGVQPFANLVAASDGKWTSAHCQTGRAKLHVKLIYDADAFPQGIPNITCVVKGRKVYDPRLSPGASVWSANAALCINDYMTNAVGLGATYATEIDEDQLIAAANICDENVTLAGGGTEDRYSLNGAFLINEAPRAVLSRLLTACAGRISYIAGKWGIHPAAYQTPSITLTLDDLRGAIRVQPRLSRRDLANAVKGIYLSPDTAWQPADYPPVVSATYYAEDNNERIWLEMDLPFTTSVATAQRLAKLTLLRNRQQITVELKGKIGCYRLQPGDTVMLTIARYGYSAKVFEVVSSSLVFEGAVIGCDLVLRETASSVYTWTAGTDETEVDAAPATNLPDPFADLTPTLGTPVSGTSELYVAGDGTVFSRIAVPVTAPANPYIDFYELQFARSSGSPQEWQDAPRLPRDATRAFFYPVEDGAAYDGRVRIVTTVGNRGSWAYFRGHTVIGKTELPSDVTGASAVQTAGTVVMACNEVADADLDAVEVRLHDEGETDWDNASPIANILRGQTVTSAAIPPGTWELLFKARDTSGNYSANAQQVSITVTSTGYTSISSNEQAPEWRDGDVALTTGTAQAGSATTLTLGADEPSEDIYTGNRLYLTGGAGAGQSRRITGYDTATKVATLASAWDAEYPGATTTYRIPSGTVRHWTGVITPESGYLASELDWEVFDEFVPEATRHCYYTAALIDKSVEASARIYADIVSVLGPGESTGIAAPGLQIDTRTASGSFDGFEDWTVGSATFRYLLARLHIDTDIGKPVISGFEVSIDAPSRAESGTVDVGAGGSQAASFANAFHVTPVLVLTPQGSGDVSASYTDLASTGFTAYFKTAGVAGAGTISYNAQGA